MDVCRPLWKGTTFTLENPIVCNDNNHFRYITDFECTSDYPESRKRDGRLSFMSDHSSFAAFCLVYLVVSPQKSQKSIKFNSIEFLIPFPFRSTFRWWSSGQPSVFWDLYINAFWYTGNFPKVEGPICRKSSITRKDFISITDFNGENTPLCRKLPISRNSKVFLISNNQFCIENDSLILKMTGDHKQ